MVQGRGITVAKTAAMDALDLIKQDHKRLRKLLEDTLGAEGSEREERMDGQRPQRDGAVHCAGIDIGEAQPLRQALGDRALTRARRPVDRHHQPPIPIVRQESE